MIRVGILTSSRADYGIYLPLLKAFKNDKGFDLKIIVFGTHLSQFHGYTLSEIENDGFKAFKKIDTLLISDSSNAIASGFSLTAQKFSEFWEEKQNEFDLVFCLGDRFEMAGAVFAGIPYRITFAHLHGGEMTLGAIDNIYRHSISLASKYHFVSTLQFKERLKLLLDNNHRNIYNIGSLSLENIVQLKLLSLEEFKTKWGIDLSMKTLLVTVHPETVVFEKNKFYCNELIKAFKVLSDTFQIVITMPNADTYSLEYRKAFIKLSKITLNVKVVENFGTQSYFTCLRYAKLLIGNSSSGIVEAASFNKYVLNIGERQKGRLSGKNVIHLPFRYDCIIKSAIEYTRKSYDGINIYYQEKPSQSILKVLKQEFASLL